ncbi:hypothetical protein G7Y89_g5555 [Cudoniella acicularis]|uniref:DUF4038 domain-containing protein n=1 Tax=Cudoniella acicularis TaxID=354080 RepID=A0A8H4W6D5_9HELO|nr:hypothetical protein G7Y89_g5555 [Cudoniella acicularis]
MRLSSIALYLGLLSHVFAWQMPDDYPISPSGNGRHFVTKKGDPFFWQADTGWLLFHRLNLTQVETYLDDRASKGFNIVLAVGLTQLGDEDPNRNGDLPLLNGDPTKPNEPYWEYIDTVVQMAWGKGIRIAMVPAWGYYVHVSNNVAGSINASNAKDFGNWIGKRYPGLPKLLVADTNPYWTNKTAVSSDYTSGGVHSPYSFTDYIPVYDEMAAGLIEGEGANAQITTHSTNQWFEGGPIALASAFFGNKQWLTFDSSQSGHSNYAPNAPIPWWNAAKGYEPVELMYATKPARPALDNEAHYENRYINGKPINPYWNASDVRTGSYQAVFSGAAGLTYGADNVMQFYIPGLFTPAGSGPAISWATDIHLPGSSQMQYIKKVILDRSASPLNRIPDQSIIVGDTGTDGTHLVATRDVDGKWLAVYTPTGAAFTIDTGKLQTGKKITASWFDPLDGSYARCVWNGEGKSVFTPPTNGTHVDWVLVLEVQ